MVIVRGARKPCGRMMPCWDWRVKRTPPDMKSLLSTDDRIGSRPPRVRSSIQESRSSLTVASDKASVHPAKTTPDYRPSFVQAVESSTCRNWAVAGSKRIAKAEPTLSSPCAICREVPNSRQPSQMITSFAAKDVPGGPVFGV